MATPVLTGIKGQGIAPLPKRKAWKALQAHYKKIRELHLRDLFAADRKRGERMTSEAVGLFLDYSKNRITDETLKLLLGLAEESGLQPRMEAMFRGEKINSTEKRAVSACGLARAQKRPPSLLTAKTWCRKCMPCSTGWRSSQTACGVASGKGIPASAFETSSTSGLAAPTWGRSWLTRRSSITAIAL